jgi:type IV pilus assembly protein PilV
MKQIAIYKRKSKAKPYSNGFTLLEILVSIVVLSFGLLGMVGIQAMALKSNSDARQQSAAVQLAGELSDMMRGNQAVALGLTAATNPYLIADFTGGTIAVPTEKCTDSTGCTSTFNVATWEKYDWLTRVNATFPGVRVQVCYDKTPYTSGGIPKWGCDAAAAPAAGDPISIKIGWTRESFNKTRVQTGNATADATANEAAAFVKADVKPSVIYTVTPGTGI